MKTSFQAKDIQNILDIPKHRYDYLATKIGIKPDLEEVEGTGHTHRYSFKNLLEFAVSHTANNLGLGPKAVKELLDFLATNVVLVDSGFYDPEKEIVASVHYFMNESRKFFKLSGVSDKRIYPWTGFENIIATLKNGVIKADNKVDVCEVFDELAELPSSDLSLLECTGCITVNIGVIKNKILKKIR